MRLELNVPGLLAAPERLLAQLVLPDCAALRRWCVRAIARNTLPGRYGCIAELLRMPTAPLAALAWLGATDAGAEENVLLATPVHLRAGMHDLVLFAGPTLRINDDERLTLARDLAASFGATPRLSLAANQWFLHTPEPLAVSTTPLYRAQGETVRGNLPEGPDAARLHAWMNEWQMFLHSHAVNRERAARSEPTLNGFWIWGEGALPARDRERKVAVFAESLPMRGLGRWLGDAREHRALDNMLPVSGCHVIELTACVDALDADDAEGWQAAVQRVSQDYLQPVLDWLAGNPSAEAVLHAGDGKARLLRGGGGVLRRMQRVFGGREEPVVSEEQ
ncbi:MAG TPA: hypothetical protein VF267_10990 [Gammaproteobacteria bacterium]